MLANSWTTVAGQVVPFSTGANYEVIQIDETRAWMKRAESMSQFDMDTRTVRNDLTIPACPITRK